MGRSTSTSPVHCGVPFLTHPPLSWLLVRGVSTLVLVLDQLIIIHIPERVFKRLKL